MRGLAHGEPHEVRGINGIGDFLLLEKTEVGRDFCAGEPVARVADGHSAKDAGCEAATSIFGFDAHGEVLPGQRMFRKRYLEWLQFNSINRCGFTRDAIVVHGIHAVGGEVHLVQ
jgi:hypothetical protein